MRRKYTSALSILTCLSAFVALMFLTRQIKLKYNDIRKFRRLQDYTIQVNEMQNTLDTLEENAQNLEQSVNLLKIITQENIASPANASKPAANRR